MHRLFRFGALLALWAGALVTLGCGSEPAGTGADALPALDEAAADAYRQEILPTEAETRWETIDWLTTYADGLQASSDQQKPLLLWVMNGHPLGCT